MKKISLALATLFLFSLNTISQEAGFSEMDKLMKLKNELSFGFYGGNEDLAATDKSLPTNMKASADDYGNTPDWAWITTFGGSGKDVAQKVAIATDGSFFVTGSFSGEMSIGQNNYTSTGRRDAFLAKFKGDGELLWFRQFSPNPGEMIVAYDVHLDASGNIYFTGYFTGDVSFGAYDLPGTHKKNLFLVQTNSNGEIGMATTHPTGNPQELGFKVDTDSNGNIFVLGSTDGTTNFRHQSVIVKYASDGSVIFDYYHDQSFADMQIVGEHIYFVATVNSSDSIGDFYLELNTYNDAFIAKSDTEMEFIWVEKASHLHAFQGDSYGTALYISADEEIYFTGGFRSNVRWGPFEINSSDGAFVTKCSPDGEFLWAIEIGDGSLDKPTDISGNDEAVFISSHRKTTYFDPTEINHISTFNLSDGAKTLEKDFEDRVESLCHSQVDGAFLITQDADELIRMSGLDNSSLNMEWTTLFAGTSAKAYGIGMDIDQDEFIYNFCYASNQLDYFGHTINKGLFLAKQWGSGTVKWVVQFPEADPIGNFSGNYLIADTNSNNVYITGKFHNPLVIPGGPTLTPATGYGSIFIIKYDFDGNFLWAVQEDILAYYLGLACDKSGNVLLTGLFKNTITIGNTDLFSAGSDDIFIAKYNSSGEVVWAKSAGGEDTEYTGLVSTDGEDNIFLTGEFYSVNVTIDDYPITLDEGDGNIVLAKLDPQGNTQWVTAKGGSTVTPYADYYGWPTGIHTDIEGYSYVKGWHNDSAHFDNIVLTSVFEKPENEKRWNKFVAKFDPDGNTVWASTISEVKYSFDYNQFDVDQLGNLYSGLRVQDTIVFGEDFTYVNVGNNDLIVARYANDGSLDWVKTIEDSEVGSAWLNTVAAFDEETSFVGGWFTDYLDFGSSSFVVNNKTGFIGLLGEPVAITVYERNDETLAFDLFPNPARQIINIHTKDKLQNETKLLITDIAGRQIVSSTIAAGHSNIAIDLSELDAGVYLARLKSGKKVAVKKFIVD